MTKIHLTPSVECTKIISAPPEFSFTHMYERDGRYLQDYARHSKTRMEFSPATNTIRLAGTFENVHKIADHLRKFMNLSTQQDIKVSLDTRPRMNYFIIAPHSSSYMLTRYEGVRPNGLQQEAFIFKRIGKPEYMREEKTNDLGKMGISIDTISRLEDALKLFSMVLFSDKFAEEEVSRKLKERDSETVINGYCLQFQLGKQLFLKSNNPGSPSPVMNLANPWVPSPVSLLDLRQMEYGAKKDFRALFQPTVDFEISEILRERLLDCEFKHVKDEQILNVRFYDRIDDLFLTATYLPKLNQEGRKIPSLKCLKPSFSSGDNLVLMSSVDERHPDIRLSIKREETYGPNHPHGIYAWPFAQCLSWSERDMKINVESDLPWSRFDINMWERISQHKYSDGNFEIVIEDITDNRGELSCRMSGRPIKLDEKLQKFQKLQFKEILKMTRDLCLLISP